MKLLWILVILFLVFGVASVFKFATKLLLKLGVVMFIVLLVVQLLK